jgi:hypothetical protein
MARRVPLQTLTDVSKEPRVEKLLARPEVHRLTKIDEEMRQVANDNSLPMDKRVRLFEEKLAEFKKVRNYLLTEGVQMMPEEEKSLEDKVKDVVASMLEGLRDVDQPSEELVIDDEFKTPTAETPTTKTAMTPVTSRRTQPQNKVHDMIKADLQTQGVLFDSRGNRVKALVRGGTKTYQWKTLEEAINYLISPNRLETGPHKNWKLLLPLIYDSLRNLPEFETMLRTYPNLASYDKMSKFPIQNWESGE